MCEAAAQNTIVWCARVLQSLYTVFNGSRWSALVLRGIAGWTYNIVFFSPDALSKNIR